VIVVYAVLTISVMVSSPMTRFDQYVYDLRWPQHLSGWFDPTRHLRGQFDPIHAYVALGVRRRSLQLVVPILLFLAWRRRSVQPLIIIVSSVLLMNLTVGIVKLSTGRLPPRPSTPAAGAFQGGDIFPSGHVSNAVVIYGMLVLVTVGRWRVLASAVVTFLSVTIGVGTLMLGTHWVSDVVGGWLAGLVVLFAVGFFAPRVTRLAERAPSRARVAVSLTGIAVGTFFPTSLLVALFGSQVTIGTWVRGDVANWLPILLIVGGAPWALLVARWLLRVARSAVRLWSRREVLSGRSLGELSMPDDRLAAASERVAAGERVSAGVAAPRPSPR
jgi:membrane-associated phospholipid phosphatase